MRNSCMTAKWAEKGKRQRLLAILAVQVIWVAVAVTGVTIRPAFAAQPAARPSVGVLMHAAERHLTSGSAPGCFTTSADCTSTDPDVAFSLFSDGDTSGCTFDGEVTWGDGADSSTSFGGGADGDILVTFGHTYTEPGTYEIDWSADVTSGSTCSSNSGTLQFTLAEAATTAEQGGADNPSENSTDCSILAPVNCATGVFWHEFTDIQLPGRGVPLDFSRTYVSSRAGVNGPFGFGWTDSYGMSLAVSASGAITVAQEDGSSVAFEPDGSGGYTAPARVLATLTKNQNGTYAFTRDHGHTTYTFSAAGKLTSETDLNGFSTKLTYNGSGQLTAVTDPAGRKLTLAYSSGRIVKLTDPMGRSWSYAYDASGNLARATDPMGRTWSFSYGTTHLLLSMKDPRGGVTTSAYNSSGQVVSQTDPDGGKTTWSYSGDATSPAGGTTTTDDADGDVTIYDYTSLELTSVTHAAGTPEAATTSYTYDPATLGVTSVTDPDGNVTTSTYDASGDLLTKTNPLGNVTSYTYNGLGEVLTRESPQGETTSYSYDSRGNLITVTDPLGGITTYTYADTARPGDVTAVTDPDGHVTGYTYDAAGDVVSQQVSPAHGVSGTTEYVYDADSERACSVAPDNVSAHVTCPAAGQAHRRGTTATAYDADGEITSVTNPEGEVTSYSYDGDGNKVKAVNAGGQVTRFAYNGDGLQISETRPDGTTLTTKYDGNGNVTSQTDAAGHVTRYGYDAQGRRVSATDPLGRVTKYGYDLAGNQTTVTDPKGAVTTYSYNGDNQLTLISYSNAATPAVAYTYDSDGKRSSMTDGTGTTTYAYDADGRLTSETDGAGATVSYGYDPAGLVTSLSYPNGQVVTRSYDGAGRVTSVEDWLGKVTRFGYDADGNVTSESYPNGVRATVGYDTAGQLMSVTDRSAASTLASFSYARNGVGQVTSETDGGAFHGTHGYSYTRIGQLASDGTGSYGYDKSGNLTKLPGGITQTYDADGELTAKRVTPPAPATDQLASANDSSKAASIVSPAVTTRVTGELILAAVTANGPRGKKQRVNAVSGGHLKWSLAVRSNAGQGTSEIWQARATGRLAHVKITAALSVKGYDGSITVATFTGAGPIGSVAAASASKGGPVVPVKTSAASSVIWAAGVDWEHARARVPASGQALVHQDVDAKTSSTYWVQRTAAIPAAKTPVEVADTAPANDGWELSAVEITSAARANAGQLRYGYDKDGNQTSIGPVGGTATTLTYDQANRLVTYGNLATYSYDGDGLRMSQTSADGTTTFAWDQEGALPLLLTAGPVSYVYGPGGQPIEQLSGTTATYLQDDRQGSTRLLTSSSGALAGTYSYGSFGTVAKHTGTASTALRYDGQYTDPASGLQYLRARNYNPATAQFTSKDPLTDQTQDPYLYTSGNPVNQADLSGLCAFWDVICWFTSSPASSPSSPCDWLLFPGLGGVTGGSGTSPQGPVYPNYQDPSQPPGPDWEWRGTGDPGSSQGSWYNPQTQQSLHPDFDHGPPIGPHYDYSGPDTWNTPDGKIRLFEGDPIPQLAPPATPEVPQVPEEIPEFPEFPDIPIL